MIVYPDIVRFIKSLAPLLRKTRLVNLALLASAIILRRSLCLSELARAYTSPEKHCYRLKRLWRFLDNPKVDFSLIRQRLTILSYSIETSPGLLLPLLMDTTYFEPYAVLSVSIPRGGRALPVAWDAYYHRFDQGESQNQREEALITSCLRQIARGIKTVLIGDRAFGRASLFSFLKERETHFVIRVSDKVHVSHPYFDGLLHDLPLKVGKRIWLEGLLYRQDRVVKINLLAIWGIGQKDPWYLATTLSDPNLVYRLYRKRMKIEHGFRDWKHHLRSTRLFELKIPKSRFVRAVHRARMLVNAIVIAYWFICLVGIKAKARDLKAKVASWGDISFFRLALELVSSGRLYPPWVSRVLDWVADKLLPFQPLFTYWQHQYQRRLVKSG
jgi:hypothetical protein